MFVCGENVLKMAMLQVCDEHALVWYDTHITLSLLVFPAVSNTLLRKIEQQVVQESGGGKN